MHRLFIAFPKEQKVLQTGEKPARPRLCHFCSSGCRPFVLMNDVVGLICVSFNSTQNCLNFLKSD